MVWNPAEANSLAFVTEAREVASQMKLTLLEANADNTPAVGEALRSLYSRSAQAIWVGGDNTVIAAIGSVIAASQRRRLPVFTILPGAPDRGTLFDVGPDFYQIGRLGGLLAADVLDGADMARIPIRDVLDVVPPYLSVNTTRAEESARAVARPRYGAGRRDGRRRRRPASTGTARRPVAEQKYATHADHPQAHR